MACISGCLTTKHERQLERAKRKIERQVLRFPELNRIDTIEAVKVEIDTVYIDGGEVDTFFKGWQVGDTLRLADTVTMAEVITVIKENKIYQKLTVPGDTIRIIDTVRLSVPVERIVIRRDLWFEMRRNAGRLWWLLVVVAFLAGIGLAIKKYLFG